MEKKISLQGNERVRIDEAFDRFFTYCQSKNLSQATLRYYKSNFKRFQEFLEKEYEKEILQISEINQEIIEKFRLYLLNKEISSHSINTYLRAVRVFLYYAMDLNWLHDYKIKLINAENKIKETYTEKVINKLLKKPDLERCNFPEYRNWIIINWLLATGNRSRTLRNVKIGDLNFKDGYVKLKSVKNKKQRIIPLSKYLIEVLTEYLQYREGDEEEYLFCTIYGKKFSSDGLNSALRRYNKKRGVDKTSIHLYRHTFSKLWIKNGGDIFRLQKILGHKSMDMVREYVNMFGEDL